MMLVCCLFLGAGLLVAEVRASPSDTQLPKIPVSAFREWGLAAFKNRSEYLNRYLTAISQLKNIVPGAPVTHEEVAEYERFGSDLKQIILPHAECSPRNQTVSLPNTISNRVIYPSCVEVPMCGGCCGHDALTCRPTNMTKLNVQVTQTIYDGINFNPSPILGNITIDIHTACQCQCRTLESDCNPALHTYDQFNCECVCNNQDEARRCATNKLWNPTLCTCQCVDQRDCGDGYRFNAATCLCEQVVQKTVVTTPTPCPNLRCPKPAVAQMQRGVCICVTART